MLPLIVKLTKMVRVISLQYFNYAFNHFDIFMTKSPFSPDYTIIECTWYFWKLLIIIQLLLWLVLIVGTFFSSVFLYISWTIENCTYEASTNRSFDNLFFLPKKLAICRSFFPLHVQDCLWVFINVFARQGFGKSMFSYFIFVL